MTAETMKWRRRITTRCRKITDIAFSSTVKASELKNTMVASSSQPITLAMVEEALQLADRPPRIVPESAIPDSAPAWRAARPGR